jgi:hypothetical protein
MRTEVSIMNIQANQAWRNWLNTPIRNEYEDVWKVHEWVNSLCIDGIIPMLDKYGYIINLSNAEFVNCMMNYMYRWDSRNKHGYISCLYKCTCMKNNATEDDEWYYNSMCIETEQWEDLKKMFFIEDYADDSEFAYRLWCDIPSFVFKHININDSPATITLDNMLNYDDDENDSDNELNKKGDPYIADYS